MKYRANSELKPVGIPKHKQLTEEVIVRVPPKM